jgi:hypothetical protein
MQLVKEKTLTGIGDNKVPHNDARPVIAQVSFSDTEKMKQVNPRLVGNPHNGIVAHKASVAEVPHLDLKIIAKLVYRLLSKFNGWHAQVLQQFPSEVKPPL